MAWARCFSALRRPRKSGQFCQIFSVARLFAVIEPGGNSEGNFVKFLMTIVAASMAAWPLSDLAPRSTIPSCFMAATRAATSWSLVHRGGQDRAREERKGKDERDERAHRLSLSFWRTACGTAAERRRGP